MKRWRCGSTALVVVLIAVISFLPACASDVATVRSAPQALSSSSSSKFQLAKVPLADASKLAEASKAAESSPNAAVSKKADASPTPRSSATAKSTSSSNASISSTVPSSPPDPSGESVPIGNLPGWKQVFYDDFQNETVSTGQFSGCSSAVEICSGLPSAMQSKWWDYPDGWPDTMKNCEYEPSQTLSVSGDVMNMFIHASSSGTCMTAAPVAKLPNAVDASNGQLYGMYSVRMRSDAVPGYKTAFLLWPDNSDWPEDGEIDFPEGNLDGTAWAYMHHLGATNGTEQDPYNSGASYTSWHTYTIEWAPNYVKFLLDGRVVGDSTDTQEIPNTPMHWVMMTESEINSPKPSASAQGNLQIAWAAVWSYDPSTS